MSARPTPARRHPHYTVLPETPLGWTAVALAVGYFVLVSAWMVIPWGAALGFVAGVAGAMVGLRAILHRGERAITVYAAVAPLGLVAIFVLAELLVPH